MTPSAGGKLSRQKGSQNVLAKLFADRSFAIEAVRGTSALRAIVPEWEELASVAGARIFRFPTWALSWAQLHQAQARPFLVTARCEGRLVALGAFVESKTLGVRVVRAMGHGSGQTDGLLFLPSYSTSARAIWEELMAHSRASVFELHELEGSIQPAADQRWRVSISPGSTCPRVALTDTYEEFLQSRPAQLRDNLARSRHRMARDGLDCELVRAQSPGELRAIVAEIASLVHSSKVPGHSAAFGQFSGVIGSLAACHRIHAVLMRIGSQPAGFAITLLGAGIATGYLMSYDPATRRYSPGHQCVAEQVRWAYESGVKEMDFSLGDAPYKWLWCDDSYQTVHVCASTSATASTILRGAQSGREILRKASRPVSRRNQLREG